MNEQSQAASPGASHMRPGLRSLTPYLVVENAAPCIDFLKAAFAASERFRAPAADGSIKHAELAIGNGAVELSDASAAYPAAPLAIHLYVEDADATCQAALRAGASSIYPVADQPWGDRQGAVKDPFGNHWYIAQAQWTPGPEGIPSVQPFLHLREADRIIPFLASSFAAHASGVAKADSGEILHATIQIGDATLEIDEAHDEFQPMPCYLHVYVPDTDAAYARALQAGAVSVESPHDTPYRDRSAAVRDAWGNSWFIATYLSKASAS